MVDVIEMLAVVVGVAHTTVCEASLPDGEGGIELSRKAAFDELDGTFDRDLLRGEQEMYMVRHDNIAVELVMAFRAVVLDGLEEEFGVSCF